MMTAVQIRQANPTDLPAIETVLRAAFPTDLEARLVNLLISHHTDTISLVACVGEQVVGHVLFSPATCDGPTGRTDGLGLAPLAVVMDFQRRGIGSALVRAGLDECRNLGAPWVVVLGEPAYYGRFGFEPASRFRVTGEFGGEDAFQLLVLDDERRPSAGGKIEYASEFRSLISI
jgi:putative acetyltransferase